MCYLSQTGNNVHNSGSVGGFSCSKIISNKTPAITTNPIYDISVTGLATLISTNHILYILSKLRRST